jgi:hypothetical protein
MATFNFLLLLFVLLVPSSAQVITPKAKLPQDEAWHAQDVLDPELDVFEPLNAALAYEPFGAGFQPSSILTSPNRRPRGMGNPFKKRNNYCFSDAPKNYCVDSNLCCTDKAKKTGWCCWFTLECVSPYTVNSGCRTPT